MRKRMVTVINLSELEQQASEWLLCDLPISRHPGVLRGRDPPLRGKGLWDHPQCSRLWVFLIFSPSCSLCSPSCCLSSPWDGPLTLPLSSRSDLT